MRLTVLGCSGSFPGPDSPASSYLVEHDGFRLVLDMGNGSLGSLQRHVGLFDVDAIFVSHLHADHCLDMCSYVVARRYHPQQPDSPVPVLGPAGAHERLLHAYDSGGGSLEDVYDFRDAASALSSAIELGPLRVTTARVNHPVETYAVRVEAGGVALTYSADTGESPALVSLARESDVFLCEASFTHGPDNPRGLHLSGREAGQHATAAGVGRLLVTHIPAWTDGAQVMAEVEETFAGASEAVKLDGVYEV